MDIVELLDKRHTTRAWSLLEPTADDINKVLQAVVCTPFKQNRPCVTVQVIGPNMFEKKDEWVRDSRGLCDNDAIKTRDAQTQLYAPYLFHITDISDGNDSPEEYSRRLFELSGIDRKLQSELLGNKQAYEDWKDSLHPDEMETYQRIISNSDGVHSALDVGIQLGCVAMNIILTAESLGLQTAFCKTVPDLMKQNLGVEGLRGLVVAVGYARKDVDHRSRYQPNSDEMMATFNDIERPESTDWIELFGCEKSNIVIPDTWQNAPDGTPEVVNDFTAGPYKWKPITK